MSNKEVIKFGTVNLPSGNTSVVVTFPDAFPANQTYVPILGIQFQDSVWADTVSRTGFTANFGTGDFTYNQTIHWMCYMQN